MALNQIDEEHFSAIAASSNKANQHGSLKALRQKRATLLTRSYLGRYIGCTP